MGTIRMLALGLLAAPVLAGACGAPPELVGSAASTSGTSSLPTPASEPSESEGEDRAGPAVGTTPRPVEHGPGSAPPGAPSAGPPPPIPAPPPQEGQAQERDSQRGRVDGSGDPDDGDARLPSPLYIEPIQVVGADGSAAVADANDNCLEQGLEPGCVTLDFEPDSDDLAACEVTAVEPSGRIEVGTTVTIRLSCPEPDDQSSGGESGGVSPNGTPGTPGTPDEADADPGAPDTGGDGSDTGTGDDEQDDDEEGENGDDENGDQS